MMEMIRIIFQQSVQIAIRGRYAYFPLALAVVMVIAGLLGAMFSGRQPATVCVDIGVSVIRAGVPFLIAFLAQELVTREFDRRYFLNSMTFPITRATWLVGRFIGLVSMVWIVLLVLSIILAGTAFYVSKTYTQATPVAMDFRCVLVVAFMAVDFFVICAVAVLVAVTAKTPSFVVVGTLGFTVLARSYSAVLAMIQQTSGLVSQEDAYLTGLNALHYLIPDLGLLDVRAVALYGKLEFIPVNWPQLTIGSIAYGIALCSLSVWALQRKSLS